MIDHELVGSLKGASVESFQQICSTYYERMFLFFWRRTQNREESKRLINKLFSSIWVNRASLEFGASLETFMYRHANEMAFQHLSTNPDIQLPPPDDSNDFSYHLNFHLNSLPENHKVTFILARYERLPFNEIAEVMRIPQETVESYLASSVKYLMDKTKALFGDESIHER